MKKFLGFLLGAAVVCTLVPMANASATETCGADQVKMVVHYQAFDGAYDGAGFYGWAWTNGLGVAGLYLFDNDKTDDFGAYKEICVDKTNAHADGTNPETPGMAFFYANADLKKDGSEGYEPDTVDKGWDVLNANRVMGKDKNAVIDGEKMDAAWKTGEVHIYYYQQQKNVAIADGTAASQKAAKAEALGYIKDGLGVTKVVYYSQLEDYKDGEDESWEIWTWSTGKKGSQCNDDGGVQFGPTLYANDQGVTVPVRVAYIYTDTDAGDEIGFIVRSFGGWSAKKYDGDINIDVKAVKGSGVQEVFYFAGESGVTAGAGKGAEFLKKATTFSIIGAEFLSADSVTVTINKAFATAVVKELNLKEAFTVLAGDTAVAIDAVRFDEAADSAAKFTIVFTAEVDKTKTYTAKFAAKINDVNYAAEKVATLDNEGPVVFVNDTNTITVKAGTKLVNFKFSATDGDTNLTGRAYVKEGSIVDTSKVGTYDVTIVCTDDMGNTTEQVIKVVVTDNCVEEAPKANYAIIGLLPLALVGGFVAFKKFTM